MGERQLIGRVVSIVHTPRGTRGRPQFHYVRAPLEAATLAENVGIEGDAKGRPGRRQLNVMVAEVVEGLGREGFRTGPGELGEQIVVSGIAAESLTVGSRLRIGKAVVEVTLPRTGCDRFEAIQGKPKASVTGRLGVMARVVVGGEVRVGDAAELEPVARQGG